MARALVGSLLVLMACRGGSETVLVGSLYANDAGTSHGGFEWTGTYEARLESHGIPGTLTLTSQGGMGDSLTVHRFAITDLHLNGDELTFVIDGTAARLPWKSTDTIWGGHYDDYFVANATSDPAEAVGTLSTQPFSGFAPWFYVELRLRPE